MGVGGGRAGGVAAQAAGELQSGVMTTDGSEFGVGYQEEELGRRARDPRQVQASSTGKDDEKASSHGSTAREQKEHIAELETEVGKLKQQLREARREARRGEEVNGGAQGPSFGDHFKHSPGAQSMGGGLFQPVFNIQYNSNTFQKYPA